jgi:hypothetical protein
VLLLFNVLAYPVYWYWHIWRQQARYQS